MSIHIRFLGFIFVFIGLIFNPYLWIQIFDADGYLSPLNKKIIWTFDALNLLFGFTLIYKSYSSKDYLNSKKFQVIANYYFRNLIYFIYFILTIEILSFLTLKVILPKNIINRVNIVLGHSNNKSIDISWKKADLWSNYTPNPLSNRCNKYGYRYGGGPKKYGAIRILCIGGSTTWGDGVPWGDQSYPAQLEKYLSGKGYNVDIVNAGVPYYTSAEVLTNLCFKGIYSEPDIVLVHTGGNDIGPLTSPKKYKPDYSHWRQVGGMISDNVFVKYYNKLPSSTFRLFLIYFLKPGTGNSVGVQLSVPKEEMIADTDLTEISPAGLITNFRNIISITKSSGAKPVAILFNSDHNRKNSLARKYFNDSDKFTKAKNRTLLAKRINNAAMDSLSNDFNVPVIPFDKWNPKNLDSWIDHCHLDINGIKEKAIYIGDYLINNKILNINKYD